MDKELLFLNVMNKTKVLRPPKHTLATFGTTVFDYVLLSPVPDAENRCRLREGQVTAQRPQIITPDLWKKRFEGFGDESDLYKGAIDQTYGEAFRGLEYTFKNVLTRTSLETATLPEVADRAVAAQNQENALRKAVLQGPDATWGLSVMKFIVEMSMRSFPVNVRELDEHDYFHPERRLQAQTRARIERLFQQAVIDPTVLKNLGETLKETGMFSEYEDRFFALIRNRS
jgi:hypothetical protein